MVKKVLAALVIIGTLSGCSDDASAPKSASPGETSRTVRNFETPILSSDCDRSFAQVSQWEDELFSQIGFGEAACVKKVLETGRVDVNKPAHRQKFADPILPLELALDPATLFYAEGKLGAYSVIKVLLEAGALPRLKADSTENILHLAFKDSLIVKKYPSVIYYLIQSKKVSLSEFDGQGLSPYHLAITRAEDEALKLMIAQGIDLNQVTDAGTAPLILSLSKSIQFISERLIRSGVSLLVTDTDKNTPLMLAIDKKMVSVAQLLLDKKATPENIQINAQNKFGETALFKSVVNHLPTLTEKLLEASANVDLHPSHTTVLHQAINLSTPPLMHKILDKTKETRAVDSLGDSAAHLAVRHSYSDLLARMILKGFAIDLENKNAATPLFEAVVDNKLAMADLLLQAKASPNAKNQGSSFLQYTKNFDMVQLLVKYGTDINSADAAGRPMIAKFIELNDEPTVAFLLNNKAEFKWVSPQGMNFLMSSLAVNNLKMARLFLEKGISPDDSDGTAQSALFYAKTPEAIRLLVEFKANLELQNAKGKTILVQWIADYIDFEDSTSQNIIFELIDSGANVSVSEPHSKNSILHWSVSARPMGGEPYGYKYLNITRKLVEAGADVRALNEERLSVLDVADSLEEVMYIVSALSSDEKDKIYIENATEHFKARLTRQAQDKKVILANITTARAIYRRELDKDPQSRETGVAYGKMVNMEGQMTRLQDYLKELQEIIDFLNKQST